MYVFTPRLLPRQTRGGCLRDLLGKLLGSVLVVRACETDFWLGGQVAFCSCARTSPHILRPAPHVSDKPCQYEPHIRRGRPLRRVSSAVRLARGRVGTRTGAQAGKGWPTPMERGRWSRVCRRAAVRLGARPDLGGHAEGDGTAV